MSNTPIHQILLTYEQYQEFRDQVQGKISIIDKDEECQIRGDVNAKVGTDQHPTWSDIVGHFGPGHVNYTPRGICCGL